MAIQNPIPMNILRSFSLFKRKPCLLADTWPRSLTIESSFICNLNCAMCPRSAAHFCQQSVGSKGIFLPSLFDRILPFVDKIPNIDLTGWGEPLMNPHLCDYIAALKRRGCRVSFVTNGLLLTPAMSERLLTAGVDMLTLSCDAGRAEMYQRVRGRDAFDTITGYLKQLRVLRDAMGRSTLLNWAFVMMRSNVDELPEAVDRAGQAGIDRFSAKHMETAIDEANLREALFDTGRAPAPDDEALQSMEAAITQARGVAAKYPFLTLDLVHPRFDSDQKTCLARPGVNMLIDYRGNLSPCCYTFEADARLYLTEKSAEEKTYLIGNIGERGLDELLQSDRARRFMACFAEGAAPAPCEGCLQMARRPAPPCGFRSI